MNSNKFELVGKVNYVDIKYFEKGTVVTKALLGIYLGKDKDGNSNYESVELTMFGDLAEKFAEAVKKGDQVYVDGRLSVNKYTNKEGKEVKNIQLLVNDFKKVEYDKDARDFVAVGDAKSGETKAEQTELPWKK